MTVERLSVEMPLAEFVGWLEFCRAENEPASSAAGRSDWD